MDVVNSKWLQMFDWRELQMMISGASIPIDISDLAENSKYGGKTNLKSLFFPFIVNHGSLLENI